MSTNIANLRKNVPETAKVLKKCCEQGCDAISKHSPQIILKGESLAVQGERAVDCLFFYDEASVLHVTLIELKRCRYHVKEIVAKFDSSEARAVKLAKDAGISHWKISRQLFARKHPRVGTSEYVTLASQRRVLLKRCGALI